MQITHLGRPRRRAGTRARRCGPGLAPGPAGGHRSLVGPRTQEQLDAAVRALDVHLDDKTLARLDEIFPGYGTAPEHYAW